MNSMLKRLAGMLALGVAGAYWRGVGKLARIRAATLYVKGVQGARQLFIVGVSVGAVLLLGLAGFLFIHVGLFLWLPLGTAAKGLVLLALGLIYMGAAVLLGVRWCSEAFWMRVTQADRVVAEATADKEGGPKQAAGSATRGA